jgi:Ca-activated chloride channel homolog
VGRALQAAEQKRRTAKTPRLYAVVVLSDGRDTNSKSTKTDLLSLLPNSEAAEGTRIFVIAYGKDADKDTLQRIAEGSNGRLFVGGTEDVEKIYNSIAAYF